MFITFTSTFKSVCCVCIRFCFISFVQVYRDAIISTIHRAASFNRWFFLVYVHECVFTLVTFIIRPAIASFAIYNDCVEFSLLL